MGWNPDGTGRRIRHLSPNSVVTLGVLTVGVKSRVARSRWRTGVGRNSSLFSCFRACKFVSSVNFRSFRGGRADARGFCLQIFVVSGSSTSWMFIFRGNSRTFRCSAVLLKGSKTGFVCKFSYFFCSSTSSMFIFRGNSRTFRCSAMFLNEFLHYTSCFFDVFGAATSGPRTEVQFSTLLAQQHPAQELKSSFRGRVLP